MHGQARTLGGNVTAYDLARNNDRPFTAAVMSDFFSCFDLHALAAARANPRDRPTNRECEREWVGTQAGKQGRWRIEN